MPLPPIANDEPPSDDPTRRELPANREDMAIFDELPAELRTFISASPTHIHAADALEILRRCRGDVPHTIGRIQFLATLMG